MATLTDVPQDGRHHVTAREAVVLAAVERRLGNAEIAAELVVSVRTVESHIASLRRKLGVDSRAGLVTAARSRRGAAVPVPHNSFVGRDGDVEQVRAALGRSRVVTVTGPAGSGKTRLALEIAAAGPAVPLVVELEHAGPHDVMSALARAVGLVGVTGDLPAAVATAVARQPYLLVLDNCDRVLATAAAAVADLLGHAPGLRVLATSRAPLGTAEEEVHALLPLAVTGVDGAEPAAVRLFLDRSGLDRSGPDPTHAGRDPVDRERLGRICARLDGLPLALELAAARTRHLAPGDLDQLLAGGLSSLEQPGPDPRHRTLQAAVDWTWDLLDDEEQDAVRRLAALPRTFDLDLAVAVLGPDGATLTLRLLDRSLLVGAGAGPASLPARFRMLASVRELVSARSDPVVTADVARRHAHHHLRLATMLAGRARTDDSPEAAAVARHLCPEVAAAVVWAVEHDPRTALALAGALAVGIEQYGADPDSLDSLVRAATHPSVRAVAGAVELSEIGQALTYGDVGLAVELSRLADERVVDEPSRLAALHLAGVAHAYLGDSAVAMTRLTAAESLAERLGEHWQLAHVRQMQGVALRSAAPDRALLVLRAAVDAYAEVGDAMHVNNARYMMALTALEARTDSAGSDLADPNLADPNLADPDLAEATRWAEQCVEYSLRTDNRHELAHALLTRASLRAAAERDVGVHDTTATALARAVDAFRGIGDLRCLTRALVRLAAARPARRVDLLREAADVARRAGDDDRRADALEHLVAALHELGQDREAVVAFGELAGLVGVAAAAQRCPAAVADPGGPWALAAAEGRARVGVRDDGRPAHPTPRSHRMDQPTPGAGRVAGPDWVRHAIWWHVYPLGFTGAEAELADLADGPRHRLPHLQAWLDHVVALGASGVQLGPVFASQTHGYDTVDHLRVDPRLGDEDDLDAFLAAAGERGVRVLLDGVFNHVGRDHPAFRAVLEQGPSAPTASWFRLRWPDGPQAWRPGVEPDHDDFEGHHHLVALNHDEPAVVDLVVEVMNHWLDRGAAGWRLDAAYAVPMSFWAQVSARVRGRHPDAYLVGEVIHGDYAAVVREGGLDAVTQYELWKAVWSSLNDGNFHELAHALGRHDGFVEAFTPFTFVGNHDVTRIASRLADPAHLPHAVVVLATVAGTPAVYAGDEHGFTGVKEDRVGGDDAVRPRFPATPQELSSIGLPTFHHHQQMLGLRRRHDWLHAARTEVLDVTDEHLGYLSTDGEHRLLVALSTSAAPVSVRVPGADGEVLAGEGQVSDAGTERARVQLAPGGWAVLAG